jgi:hypothetical protein
MLQCQVLRCQSRATHNFVVEDAVWGMAEAMVCDVHRAALDGGQSYAYDSADNVIYIGPDLRTADDHGDQPRDDQGDDHGDQPGDDHGEEQG